MITPFGIGIISATRLPEFESRRDKPHPVPHRARKCERQDESEPEAQSFTDEPIRPVMKMTQAAYEAVMEDLAGQPFEREQGGMFLGPDDAQHLVTRYVKDEHGLSTAGSFTIDHEVLNGVIQHVRPAHLTCVGLVHSHPNGICRPSGGDLHFLHRIFSSPKNGNGSHSFLFPIVCNRQLHPFIVDTRDVRRMLPAELQLV
ncbi:MAG: Mov34/MPN/PAD-1 family protein [Planctomycetaceae bacterium]|nr:Mov34/MPN/PAD-1 family protein [Planctomycetaceae bacterium]